MSLHLLRNSFIYQVSSGTITMSCSLPPEKLDNIKYYCKEVLKTQFFLVSFYFPSNSSVLIAKRADTLPVAILARGLTLKKQLILTQYIKTDF